MTRSLGDMSQETFALALSSMPAHQRYVALHHFGESLLHKQLPIFVEHAAARGIATGLSCNPPSLKPQISERLLTSGLSEMVLSLDSLDGARYRAIRGAAADVTIAMRNIAELMRLRDATGAKTHVTLQMISMRTNESEAMAFLDYCRQTGVDRGVVIQLGRWDFADEKVSQLGEFRAPLYGAPCDRPQKSVVVLWDGRVVPCCHDYDGAVILGDLSRQTIQEIWHSPPARLFRENWNTSSLCRACAFSRSFAESRREKTGFRNFHRSRRDPGNVYEYVRSSGKPVQFDGFDVVGSR